jgi:ketol-acid reductoisomerase
MTQSTLTDITIGDSSVMLIGHFEKNVGAGEAFLFMGMNNFRYHNNKEPYAYATFKTADPTSVVIAYVKGIPSLLLPDENHGPIYKSEIEPHVTAGKTLMCSHGFAYVFGEIVPPADVDVIMVAPKSPGTEVRKRFVEGFGVPGLIAVRQNCTGKAREVALAIAKAEGLTRAGVLECTMEQETYEDLFGEQNVLCGGTVDLMKYGFEVLTEAGYPPEMAYFECVHEAKLIVDLIYEGGIQRMNQVISNTAEWGEYDNGPWILPADVRERMKESLRRIESGEFAKKWIAEARSGYPVLTAKREALGEHTVEIVGKRIRSLFEKK